MAESTVTLTGIFRDIAEAIREKSGSSELYSPTEMAEAIGEIAAMDDSVTEFVQQNSKVTAYLSAADAAYTDANFASVSVAAAYVGVNDEPNALELQLIADGTLYFNDESDGRHSVSYAVSAGSFKVYSLIPEHTYRWYLVSEGRTVQNGRLRASGKLRMIYDNGAAEQSHNMRDLGGWDCDGGRVKYGVLYRGTVPAYLTAETKAAAENALHIRSQVDLYAGDTPQLLYDGVSYNPFPLSDENLLDNLSGSNAETLSEALDYVMQTAARGVISYIHCWYGSDRTGLLCWMLHILLGVSEADSDKDYELTGLSGRAYRYRNLIGWSSVVDYFMGLHCGGLLNNVLHWCDVNGIDIGTINRFRRAMTDGMPSSLVFPQPSTPELVNVIPLSTSADSSVFNTTGYRNNCRLGSDGGVRENYSGCCVTGFVPVSGGDTVYLSGSVGQIFVPSSASRYEARVCFYNSNRQIITSHEMYPRIWTAQRAAGDPDPALYAPYSFDSTGNKLLKFSVPNNIGIAYVRFTLVGTVGTGDISDYAIISINREIE